MRIARVLKALSNRRSTLENERGFTLIELLVAIAAGSLVATAAVLLSKNAVRLFQEESRISYAQVALANGMSRMGVDIEHAGRNSTKNPRTDNRVCFLGLADWPTGMRRLAPVHIELLSDLPQNLGNDLRNERITIAGDLDSGDNWIMNSTLPGATGTTIILQPGSRSVRRLSAMMNNGSITTRLQEIFKTGRILHIEGPTNDYYGVIRGFNVTGGAVIDSISVALDTTPTVPMQPQSLLPCAIKGFGTGYPVHVISRIRYEVRSVVNDAAFNDFVQPINSVAGDETRTELIRTELLPNDDVMAGTTELITEFAIGMRFGLTALTTTSQPDAPVLERFPIADPTPNAQIYTIAGPADIVGNRPEHIRSVQVRLSTRSRAPDRPTTLPGQPGKPYRFYIGTAKGADKYARVRNLEREFNLVNMKGGFR
ncbi:MAG TPA: prepilin-type N-terminal cleavage/methylation domain-containing protein [Polyangium sp.]|nr:prepilin-type N-terminal cleavage/methylation domain-containing protein [Polyangium sp.]